MEKIEKNPLIASSTAAFAATPFNQITDDHYLPALNHAISLAEGKIKTIEKSDASFENTILGLEFVSTEADNVASVFYNLLHAHSNEKMHTVVKELAPKLSGLSSSISLNEVIFKKVKQVFDKKDSLDLDNESMMLLTKTYKSFVRNGALLKESQKEELRKIDEELSQLGPQFGENLLKATNAFELWIDHEADLEGLPESTRAAAAQAASEKNGDGKWLFTLQYTSFGPFLKYSKNRELREQLFRASASKAYNDQFDNQGILKSIVALRHKRAQLLGFLTHAHFVLEERMAQKPETVMNFLNEIYEASFPAAQNDLKEVQEFAKTIGGPNKLEPWDYSFYSDKLREKKYSYDEEKLRPYFSLDKAEKGAFALAKKLYNIDFEAVTDVPTYHPDVKTYKVSENGKMIGLFYADYFPRDSKSGGAWATSYQSQGLNEHGKNELPHISIVCNFSKPTKNKPSLITFDELLTLFHEFGHALHGLLSNVKYKSLAGTSVHWDFVELPSQMLENWAYEKECLDLFAEHFETGEKIPKDLTDTIKKSSTFQAGYNCIRQINFAFLDMAWYYKSEFKTDDVAAFELKVTEKTRLFDKVAGTNSSCSFSHIFDGGYSAGYYSYKWAEVLDADAFELFKDKGLFDKASAAKFRDHVLSQGGTQDPMDLYVKFRGRKPDPKALLRRDGLI